MRYYLICHKCIEEKKGNGQFEIQVSPNNEGIYKATCCNGHQHEVDILLHHFQVLFENGLQALADNYFFESFLSFTACYERFIEFFLNVVLKSNKVKEKDFNSTWKELAKQSERQIGAFCLIYLQEFKTKPEMLSNSNIELRNKVIHKGYFPSKADCIKFGDNILEFIRPIISLLKNDTKYNNELLSSVNSTGHFNTEKVLSSYFPRQLFAINRSINEGDNASMSDLLELQLSLKNKA